MCTSRSPATVLAPSESEEIAASEARPRSPRTNMETFFGESAMEKVYHMSAKVCPFVRPSLRKHANVERPENITDGFFVELLRVFGGRDADIEDAAVHRAEDGVFARVVALSADVADAVREDR